ncbi:DUF1003 domain-containing protein [Enterococcus sp. LJL51]|uniref:DUF1003 domain-containing protein n=1 Tax=Enterococcus sp. LJL51 TaxID=3416656 RepID=UPI003CEC5EB2
MNKKDKNKLETIPMADVEEEISSFILKHNPKLTMKSVITYPELLNYRMNYIRELLSDESLKNEQLNHLIHKHLQENEVIVEKLNKRTGEKLSLGQRTADAIAKFGGSWPFIFIFLFVLFAWIVLNSTALIFQPFDKYPFILLNLMLSCLAAIQAPIIMMSQNRQEDRDREQAKKDYKVNLKAEIEVNVLHEKMDYMINDQWQQMVKIQNIQLALLGELQEQLEEMKKTEKD